MRTVTYLDGTGSQRLRGSVRAVPRLLWQSIREEQALSGLVIKEEESKLALRVGSELSQGNGGGHVGQEGPGTLSRLDSYADTKTKSSRLDTQRLKCFRGQSSCEAPEHITLWTKDRVAEQKCFP
uniref:Uncharacterized protein n=1 Tax=Pipistrellus kuhlii TaxID=59472 RepID=A0A7J7Y987_PIPKU|nr:hypothetical protein mPipKuh1_010273 [Pipistrellus kuhlii]